jgi:hypothetical protein
LVRRLDRANHVETVPENRFSAQSTGCVTGQGAMRQHPGRAGLSRRSRRRSQSFMVTM